MSAATTVLSVLLAAAIAFAAARKLTHSPEVVAEYARAGVPEERLNLLAAILFAAAAGLLAGIAWEPLAVITTACLLAYFTVAVSFHFRAGDRSNAVTPAVLAIAAGAVLILSLTQSA
jgi:hypothetical protein